MGAFRFANNAHRFTLAPDLDLQRVADRLPFTYTGADLYALCSDAMLKAITRSARLVDDRVAEINRERAAQDPPQPAITIAYFFDHYASDGDTEVMVAEEDFVSAYRELVPSVSAEELKHYERVRKDFEGGKEKDKDTQKGNAVANTASGPASASASASALARRQMADMLRAQMKSAVHDTTRSTNGNGTAAVAAPAANDTDTNDDDDDDDDDYIIKTDHLSLNGHGKGKGKAKAKDKAKGKGKGKGKARVADGDDGEGSGAAASPAMQAFGDAADGDDDMYS